MPNSTPRTVPLFVVSLLVAITSALIGCGKGDPAYFGRISPLHPPNELWVNNSGEPEYIDPGKCSDSTGGELIWNLFAGLTDLHPATLEPIPAIAERWDISDDGTKYTFHLRESKWSDGRPFTAHDFEWSWKRVLNPKTAAKYNTIMYPLKNAVAFNQQALVLENLPEGVSDDAIKTFVEAVVPVDKIQRVDGKQAFVFVPVDTGHGDETEDKTEDDGSEAKTEPQISNADAASQLNGKLLAGTPASVRVADDSIVGVRAIDDLTLEVELEYPVPYFLSLVGYHTFKPVPRHVIEGLEQAGEKPELWTRVDNIVCNGAYKLVEWKFRQHMLFEKNDNYWDIANPEICRIEKVRVLMVENYNTTLNLYVAGEVDWPGAQVEIPSELQDLVKSKADYHISRKLAVYFYWFNTKESPTDNRLLRKALSMSINRKEIAEFVKRGGEVPLSSVVPDGLAGYKGLEIPIFDAEKARALLAEAGYPEGKGLPKVTLIYNTSENHKKVAVAAKQMWKDNLGIDVEIENQEWKTYLGRMSRNEFQMARMGWVGDYSDPNTFLELFTSQNGNNHSNWKDPKYDEMLDEANRTLDLKERLSKLRAAEEYLMDAQPVLPIYIYARTQMIKPYLKGISPNDQDRHQWMYLWIDERWYDGKPADAAKPKPSVGDQASARFAGFSQEVTI